MRHIGGGAAHKYAGPMPVWIVVGIGDMEASRGEPREPKKDMDGVQKRTILKSLGFIAKTWKT